MGKAASLTTGGTGTADYGSNVLIAWQAANPGARSRSGGCGSALEYLACNAFHSYYRHISATISIACSSGGGTPSALASLTVNAAPAPPAAFVFMNKDQTFVMSASCPSVLVQAWGAGGGGGGKGGGCGGEGVGGAGALVGHHCPLWNGSHYYGWRRRRRRDRGWGRKLYCSSWPGLRGRWNQFRRDAGKWRRIERGFRGWNSMDYCWCRRRRSH